MNRLLRRQSLLFTIFVLVFVTFFATPQSALAADITIRNQVSCESIGGTWSGGGICEMLLDLGEGTEFIVQSGTQITIDSSIKLVIDKVDNENTFVNYGIIHNNGTLIVGEIDLNYGTIY